MSTLAQIMGTDVPAALATISGVKSLKRGLYTQDKLIRPALYFFAENARMKGSTNIHMLGRLMVTVGCWVDLRGGSYTEWDRLLEAVQVAMFGKTSNPNWWAHTRTSDEEWVFFEPVDGENVGGFWLPFEITFDHQRTAP